MHMWATRSQSPQHMGRVLISTKMRSTGTRWHSLLSTPSAAWIYLFRRVCLSHLGKTLPASWLVSICEAAYKSKLRESWNNGSRDHNWPSSSPPSATQVTSFLVSACAYVLAILARWPRLLTLKSLLSWSPHLSQALAINLASFPL